jgi:GTPase SAR1 family protein
MVPLYYRDALVALATYDTTNRGSFTSLGEWVAGFTASARPRAVVFVVGNKTDLAARRQVTYDEAEEWARGQNCEFYETSALSGEGIKELFAAVAAKVVELKLQPSEKNAKLVARDGGCC